MSARHVRIEDAPNVAAYLRERIEAAYLDRLEEALDEWASGLAGFTPEPDRELLTRSLLCRATGVHDRGPNDRCRDCGKELTTGDACAPESGFRAQPDEDTP